MQWEMTFPGALTGEAELDATHSLDCDAFSGFYQRSAPSLWAYLARVSGDPALADDLTQESFIRFLSATLPEAGEVAARRYLFRIGANLLKDHWRRPRPASLEETPEIHLPAPDLVGQAENSILLWPVLMQLSLRERELLWLAHAEGYSHREIAQITGLASASVRLLLFRARRKAAALLRKSTTGGVHGR
jgi:RNA polymerase sigma-70 factor (ECF subfamily)